MAKDITSQLVIKINDRDVVNSFNGIRSEVFRLEKGLKKLTPGTEEFMKKAAELKEARSHFERVKNEIDAVNGRLKQSEGFIGKFGSALSNLGLNFSHIFAGGVAGGITAVSSELLKISDAMADVQKTSGMALNEVKELWENFDKMDTRTSKLDRLKIAEVGGRLAVPKEEMEEFVREIDKVYVALGDSFEGGLENVVSSVGKMKGLYQQTAEKSYAEAINEIGSALNELAANSTATESNIADFTLRVGALPDALKPSIDKVMGLGAAFEESGVDSQIAASGYSNFMKVAGENLENFAYSMHMSIDEARELFNTKPEEFFLRFAQGMKDIPADETAQIFDSLKLKSLEVQKAVGAAANNTDTFTIAMRRAGIEMENGTSITNEFNTKNENAAAIWQKFKNAIADFFTENTFISWFEGAIILLNQLAGGLNSLIGIFKVYSEKITFVAKVLLVATSALVSYRSAMWLATNATKSKIQQTILYQTALKGLNLATYIKLFFQKAVAIRSAKDAMALFNIVSKANVFGIVLGAITSIIFAMQLFNKETDIAIEKQKNLNDAYTDAEKSIVSQKNELEKLVSIARDENTTKEQKLSAIKKLNEISPEYLGWLNLENINTQEATKAISKYTEELVRMSRVKALTAKMQNISEKVIDAEKEDVNKNLGYGAKLTNGIMNVFGGKDAIKLDNDQDKQYQKWVKNLGKERAEKLKKQYQYVYDARDKVVQELKDQEKEIAKEIRNLELEAPTTPLETTNIVAPTGSKGGKSTKPKTNRPAKDTSEQEKRDAQSALRGSISDWERTQKSILDSERKFWDEMLQIMEDGRAKEELQEKENYRRRVQDAEKENEAIIQQNIELQEKIAELEQKKAKTKNPEAQKDYQIAIDNYKQVIAENQKLEEQNLAMISQMRDTHKAKMQQIDEHYREKEFRLFVEQKEKEIQATLMAEEQKIQAISSLSEAKKALQNMEFLTLTETELQNIRTLEDAKKALREDAERKAMHLQLEAIKAQKTELEKLLLDPTLSKKAKAKLEKDLEELEPILTKIRGAIQGKKENDDAEKDKENRKRKESIDILGFSAQDWEDMFKNLDNTEGKIKGIIMATKALSNAFTQFAKLQQALGERELRRFTRNQDQKKKALLKQLNQGLITQEQYHKGVAELEEQTDEKKRQIQRRAAKAEKAANLMSAISGTATAVVGALGNKPWTPANFALAGIVGALGAVQIATIAAQPLPEFAVGGYTGKGSGNADRTGFRPAGIVHESEYVTPKWMLENPVVADVVDWMESIRTGRTAMPKAFAEGGFASMKNERMKNEGMKNDNQMLENQSSEINERLSQTLGEVRDLLADLKENGVDAFMIEDAENGKRLKRTIKKFEKLEQKNARK